MSTLIASPFRLLRGSIACALVVAAAAHVPVTPEHLAEAPYMGAAFALFTALAAVLAFAVVRQNETWLYWAAVALCTAAVATYAATRLVAFPQLSDDVGNWGETLGVVSMVSETLAVVLSALAIRGATLVGCRIPTSPAASMD